MSAKLKKLEPAKHLGGFALLPPPVDACQICAAEHAPELPHNAQSLFYQYKFYGDNGRWPTWEDAMAHCAADMKAYWKGELEKLGVNL